MLKRIAVQDVRLGMHLHELCGAWLDHPFWKTRFVLRDPEDLRKLRASAVKECWIDTSKGLDVATVDDGVRLAPAAARPLIAARPRMLSVPLAAPGGPAPPQPDAPASSMEE